MAAGPPADDAPLQEWRRWAVSQGRGHLDPERLRAEARRLRADPVFGLADPSPAEDLEVARPMLHVDPGLLGPDGRARLALFLLETAQRAASTVGDRHPVVFALLALGDALRADGPVSVKARCDRQLLFRVVQVAHGRARAERLEVEPAMRRVLAGVELWAYGPDGWQPDPTPRRLSPEHDAAWNGSDTFRGGVP